MQRCNQDFDTAGGGGEVEHTKRPVPKPLIYYYHVLMYYIILSVFSA